MDATDLVIRNTDAAACEASAELTCPGAGGGWGDGILALGPVALSLQDFALFDNARVAAHFYAVDASTETDAVGLSGGPTVAAENGTITNNPYGINIRGQLRGAQRFHVGGLLRECLHRGWLLQRGRA